MRRRNNVPHCRPMQSGGARRQFMPGSRSSIPASIGCREGKQGRNISEATGIAEQKFASSASYRGDIRGRTHQGEPRKKSPSEKELPRGTAFCEEHARELPADDSSGRDFRAILPGFSSTPTNGVRKNAASVKTPCPCVPTSLQTDALSRNKTREQARTPCPATTSPKASTEKRPP